jgi:hypothetical protein
MTATAPPICTEGYAELPYSSPQGDSGDAVFIDTGGRWIYLGAYTTECGFGGSTPQLPSSVCSALRG